MKFFIKSICISLLIVSNNSILGMTTLQKTKAVGKIPQKGIIIQKRDTQPVNFADIQRANYAIQRWNEINKSAWDKWANFKNRVHNWWHTPPNMLLGQSELSSSVNVNTIETLQREALETAL